MKKAILLATLSSLLFSSAQAGMGTLVTDFQQILNIVVQSTRRAGLSLEEAKVAEKTVSLAENIGNGMTVEVRLLGSLTRGSGVNNATMQIIVLGRTATEDAGMASAAESALNAIFSAKGLAKDGLRARVQTTLNSRFINQTKPNNLTGVSFNLAGLDEAGIRGVSEATEQVIAAYKNAGQQGLERLAAANRPAAAADGFSLPPLSGGATRGGTTRGGGY